MVTPTDPVWVQSEFDTLTEKFEWVGLRKNICKIVGMVCRPCWEAEVLADEASIQQMIGEGQSFKERYW